MGAVMGNLLDLRDQNFERLDVLYRTNKKDKCGRYYWHCKCQCGNEMDIIGSHLINGHSTSCGCYNRKVVSEKNCKNLVGKRVGYLVVLKCIGYNKHGSRIWACQCDCGNQTILSTTLLSLNKTKSCGCGIYGEKHHHWRGGTSIEEYPPEFNNELKMFIRNRDQHRCQ